MHYTWAGNAASGNAYRLRPVGALGGGVPTSSRQPAAAQPARRRRRAARRRDEPAQLLQHVRHDRLHCRGGRRRGDRLPRRRRPPASSTGSGRRPSPQSSARAADVVGISEIENDGYGPTSAIQFLVDRLNEATAPGTYAFIDADAGTGQTERARHRRDQGRLALQAGEGHAGRRDGGAELRRLRQRRRQRPAQPARARPGVPRERDRRQVRRRRQPPQEQGQRLRRARTPATARATARSSATNAANAARRLARERPDRHRRPATCSSSATSTRTRRRTRSRRSRRRATRTSSQREIGPDAYSYVFDGQWGYLDHALGTAVDRPAQVTGVADWHVNAGRADACSTTTTTSSPRARSRRLYAPDQFRVSDHDPVVVGLNLNAPPSVDAGGPYTVAEGGSVAVAADRQRRGRRRADLCVGSRQRRRLR